MRQEGYELWAIIAEQMVRRFGPTHEEVKALVTHRAPERMRESSYPTLAHEPPEKSDATPPSSPDVGTIGHQPSLGKLRPHT